MDHQTNQNQGQTSEQQYQQPQHPPHGQQQYQQAHYGQQQYQQPYPYPPVKPKQPAHGFAIAALVLGIVAMTLPIPVIDIIIGVLGLIFAIVAKRSGHRGGMSTAGLVLSIIGTVWAIWWTFLVLSGSWWWLGTGGYNFFDAFM